MFDIDGTLVSLELVERFFCCDLDTCLGACCIEGDSGAPLTEDEYQQLKEILPEVWDDLLPQAQQQIKEHGVAYVDVEGELVTQLVGGANCVFTTYERGGMCLCAIEKAYRQGRIHWRKPMSCYLYPVRIKRYPGYDAVNFGDSPPVLLLNPPNALPIIRYRMAIRPDICQSHFETDDLVLSLENLQVCRGVGPA